ncbi:MAG: hypothetical protein J5906_11980 [Acidaminococcaceae bacterium]|nr:hypothetical protein [Acidaminococcaceae bacterium]
MGVTVLTVLAALVLKAIAVKLYDDYKIGIWIAIVVTVLFGGWFLTTILSKVSFIPMFLLFRH